VHEVLTSSLKLSSVLAPVSVQVITGLSAQLFRPIGLLYCIALLALAGGSSPLGLAGMTLELKVFQTLLGWEGEARHHCPGYR